MDMNFNLQEAENWAEGGNEEDKNWELPDYRKDALILLIDARRKMFQKIHEKSFFEMCIQLAIQLLKNKIIQNPNALVGITFFGTGKKRNANEFEHVYELQELDKPSAGRISELIQLESAIDDFADMYESLDNNEACEMNNALWNCGVSFNSMKLAHRDNQRIWILSNDDYPNKNYTELQNRTIQQASDHIKLGRELTLIHGKTGPFELTHFYGKIIALTGYDANEIVCSMGNAEDVIEVALRKQFKKRRMTSMPLTIEKDVSIGVEVYARFVEQKKGQPIHVDANTNAPLRSETKWLCEDTGAYLSEDLLRRYISYGGKRVYFTSDDIVEIKYFDSPGIQLLGFKPQDCIKPHHNVRSSYFLFACEGYIEGSIKAFTALHCAMLKKKVVAIARMIFRANSLPRLVALVPQEELYDDFGQSQAFGMAVVHLPFADDIRSISMKPQEHGSMEQQEAAQKLVRNMKLSKGFSFPNPVIRKHYASIQALALDELELSFTEKNDMTLFHEDDLSDDTKIDIDNFLKVCGDISGLQSGATKREASATWSSGGGQTRKKATASSVSEDFLKLNYWKEAMANETLSKHKVAEMKAFLEAFHADIKGRKNELIERIATLVQNH